MPSNLSDATPTSLAHIVGQRGVVDQVRVAVDAAQQDGRPVDHALLVRPPGLGKSATARVISAEMATALHEVLGQTIKGAAALNALLLAAGDRDVVHIDEAHELPRSTQTALFLALDRRAVFPAGKDSTLQPIPLASFTLLLSTTDEFCLLQPLRDRMKLCLRFGYYSEDELAVVLLRRTKAAGWDVVESVYPAIAGRSRGTPRLALRLLTAAHRVSRADGAATITADHLTRACELEGIDPRGLGPAEQSYLSIVGGGVSRLNVVATKLGLPSRTVSEVVEPYLIRSGLLVKDDQGRRELTADGRSHMPTLRTFGV